VGPKLNWIGVMDSRPSQALLFSKKILKFYKIPSLLKSMYMCFYFEKGLSYYYFLKDRTWTNVYLSNTSIRWIILNLNI